MSSKISQFFNPAEHLVFHQDKDGAMIGGGYRVNNLLYQHKMPLFVSAGGGAASQTGGSGVGREQECSTETHFIPEKFSDLFRDLAVPAGLFMMPPMFRPRNYAFEAPEPDTYISADTADTAAEENKIREDGQSDDDDVDERNDYKTTKHAPDDIFDTLLSLVEAKERIHHDVKTRRKQMTKNRKNTTKRRK